MCNVFDVAKYILKKQGAMSTFKLQKLVYYSQAWSLVFEDKPLFKNEIFAWANGPVCRDLYDKHKGSFDITYDELKVGDSLKIKGSQKGTIDLVLKSYGGFSGQQLSNITHSENPWKKAREGLSLGERGEKVISLDSMVEYYSALYANQKK